MDHLVPVLVAQLADVHAERDQDVEGVARRHCAFRQRMAEADRFFLGIALSEQFRLEQVEIAELLLGRQFRVIGDIVGGADEVIEGKNQRAVARMDDPRRHRKVLVAVRLAGSQFGCGGHRGRQLTGFWASPI